DEPHPDEQPCGHVQRRGEARHRGRSQTGDEHAEDAPAVPNDHGGSVSGLGIAEGPAPTSPASPGAPASGRAGRVPERYVNVSAFESPFGCLTTTSTLPAACRGVVTRMLLSSITVKLVPGTPPKSTPVAPV